MVELPDVPTDTSFVRLEPLMAARRHVTGGAPVGGPAGIVLRDVRSAALEVARLVRASGEPDGVVTRPLLTQPHPASWAMHRALRAGTPTVWLTDRLVVVQWTDPDGSRQVLLWGPVDHERASETSAMQQVVDRLPLPRVLRSVHGTVPGHLRALGIDPADVTLVAFDHLHTQDVRRVLGTPGPVADVDGDRRELPGWAPRARMLVQRAEWEGLRRPHPLQSRWYQAATYADLDPDRLLVLDGDHLLGPGVAVVATPGHTAGNQSLVLHLDGRLHVVSGNGVAAEAWAPAASRLPGVRRHAAATGVEVVPRASTLEYASWQYASMVAEAALADRTTDGRFPLILPIGELTRHPLAPLVRPTHVMGALTHGSVLPSRAVSG
jgi:hypothetical protein